VVFRSSFGLGFEVEEGDIFELLAVVVDGVITAEEVVFLIFLLL